MPVYYPALILSASLFASVLVNMHDKLYGNALITSLLAIPSILFLVLLSQKNLDIIAYILILIPIILVYIGYSIGIPLSHNKPILKIIDASANIVPDRIEPVSGTSVNYGSIAKTTPTATPTATMQTTPTATTPTTTIASSSFPLGNSS